MKLQIATMMAVVGFGSLVFAQPGWSFAARMGVSHSSGHSASVHYHNSGRSGFHRGHMYRGGGGYVGDVEVQRYVPSTPNYIQSDGGGAWNQDKYTGDNPVNMTYH